MQGIQGFTDASRIYDEDAGVIMFFWKQVKVLYHICDWTDFSCVLAPHVYWFMTKADELQMGRLTN